MKQGWNIRTLGDVCKTTQGIQILKSEQESELLPNYKRYLYISDFKNEKNLKYVKNQNSEKIVTEKDLIVVNTGASAGDIFKGIDGILSNNLFKVSFDDKIIDPDFIFYFVTSDIFKGYQNHIMRGTANPHMGHENFKSTPFNYPSLSEQQRIVAILDEAFAAIAKAKANAEQNLKNAKELFESYLQGVFENKGEDWEEKKLGETCIVERGSSPRPIEKYFTNEDDGVNWIKIGDTKGVEKYIYTTKQKITKEGALNSKFVDVGDFILSNSMSFGRPYIMKTQGYIHDGWFVLRLPKNINTEFFWYLLASPYTMNQFTSLAAGAIVKNISGDLVKKTILPIPPFKEQQIIVQKLDALSTETKKLETIYQQKINDLEELKKSVLQKAFSGELKTATAVV